MTDPTLHTALAQVRDRWRRFPRTTTTLSICPENELRATAQNFGSSDEDFVDPRIGPAELMPERLKQLGLDPAYIKYERPTTYRELERVCAACKSWRRCLLDLSSNNVQAGMEGYCLNASTIDTLTVDERIATRV